MPIYSGKRKRIVGGGEVTTCREQNRLTISALSDNLPPKPPEGKHIFA